MRNIKGIISKVAIFLIFSLVSTVWNFDNEAAFDTIATFLSITIGFTIAALSIIATSSFSKELYKIEDENDNSRTLLHVLIRLFKTSNFIFISTIGLILVYKFFEPIKTTGVLFFINCFPITLFILLKGCVWCLTIVSFYYFIMLFEAFSKFVLKTATRL